MNVNQAIQELEKNKAAELFFSDIIDYVISVQNGENEVFDLRTLDLIQEDITNCLKFLEDRKKSCYDAVVKINKLEIKNDTTKRKTSGKRGPQKRGGGSKKV